MASRNDRRFGLVAGAARGAAALPAREVAGGLRGRAAHLDERADHRADPVAGYAGIASRALAFVADAVLCAGLWASVASVAALAGWMVGGLRPEWLVASLATTGLTLI